MRLEGNFYKIRETSLTDNGFNCILELSVDHPIYKGHFPSRPVVPGACTLTIIKECISSFLKRDIIYKKIKECKFISTLLPREGLLVQLELEISDMQKINCIVSSDGQTVLKLKAEI